MTCLVAVLALAALVPNALAQSSDPQPSAVQPSPSPAPAPSAQLTPLASKHFDYTALVRRPSFPVPLSPPPPPPPPSPACPTALPSPLVLLSLTFAIFSPVPRRP